MSECSIFNWNELRARTPLAFRSACVWIFVHFLIVSGHCACLRDMCVCVLWFSPMVEVGFISHYNHFETYNFPVCSHQLFVRKSLSVYHTMVRVYVNGFFYVLLSRTVRGEGNAHKHVTDIIGTHERVLEAIKRACAITKKTPRWAKNH